MARHYYGINVEAAYDVTSQVTRDTSSTGLDIEISTLDGRALTRKDVEMALDRLAKNILEHATVSGGVGGTSDYDL